MKVKLYYSYPVRVKTKRKKLKRIPVRKSSGFEACGTWITKNRIRGSKHLTKREKQMLLDMCGGVKVEKKRRVNKGFNRQVAEYLVHGKVYADGSILEYSRFKGI